MLLCKTVRSWLVQVSTIASVLSLLVDMRDQERLEEVLTALRSGARLHLGDLAKAVLDKLSRGAQHHLSPITGEHIRCVCVLFSSPPGLVCKSLCVLLLVAVCLT